MADSKRQIAREWRANGSEKRSGSRRGIVRATVRKRSEMVCKCANVSETAPRTEKVHGASGAVVESGRSV